MRRSLLVLVVVFLVAAGPAVVMATPTTTLTVEEALNENSDSDTISYTFVVTTDNETTINIPGSQTSQSAAGGDISVEFDRWEQIGSGRSGTSTSWEAEDGEDYRIMYDASTSSNVDENDEGTYNFNVDPQDDDGTTYSETFSVTFDYLSPEFGSTNSPSGDIEFTGGSSAGTRVTAEFENDGDGVMVPDSVSYSGVPSGISVSTRSLDNRVSAFNRGSFDVVVNADDSISEGTYTFTATVEDNLGNTADVTVSVEVFKPPAVAVNDGRGVDIGDVLRGGSESTSVTVSETTGYGSVDISTSIIGSQPNADASLSSLDGRISASGSRSGSVRVNVGPDATQHEQLTWTLEVGPDNPRSDSVTAAVDARVTYRPYFDSISAPNGRLVYDQPRDEVTAFRQERSVTVRNGGDFAMDVTNVQAEGEGDVSVEIIDSPSSIPALSSETIDIAFVGDPSADEGTYSYSVQVTGDEAEYKGAGSDTVEASGEVEIDHESDIAVEPSEVAFGEIPITEERTRSTDIRERLDYQDVENFEFEQVEGPDRWLTLDDVPSSLSQGERRTTLVSVEFDADATLYEEYTWRFRVDGDNVDAKTLTVTAAPRPVQCSSVVERLEEWDGSDDAEEMAAQIAAGTRVLEDRLRDRPEEGPIRDLARACTVSRSALLFLEADATARARIAEGNHTGAQPSVGRMAAGFNTMNQYTDSIDTNEARRPIADGVGIAESMLDERVETQVGHYDQTLSGDVSALQQADAYRELARLATLQGDDERAGDLSRQADESFDRYANAISEGTAALQRGRSLRDDLDESFFLSAFGVRVFWIGDLDRFESQTETVLLEYEMAREQFEAAGATSRAEAAVQERDQLASAYETAFLASAGIGGAVGLVFLVAVVYELLAVYRFIQDSQAAVTGEFLV